MTKSLRTNDRKQDGQWNENRLLFSSFTLILSDSSYTCHPHMVQAMWEGGICFSLKMNQ